MKIRKKAKLIIGLLPLVSLPLIMVSCNNERAKLYKVNKLLTDEFILQESSKKIPTIDFSKHKKEKCFENIESIQSNFRADTLWCLGAFVAPNKVNFKGKVFSYEIEKVNHLLGTSKADILINIYIDDFKENGKPTYIRNYTITMDGFKSTPSNHNHWVPNSDGSQDSCEICMTYNS
ncbi:hypothetical protein [Mycoplasma crocodyli]|uniref:Putative lipoprotein n=1 Tax=Mycoplasma crocodyli (strain ATCC 51981 / MP145) TaxID=512564 RepID=D5E508_MYCCM|nr:hypothetical protein [Mycoplasma crocodyli]ADE19935.1 putative lipoprotein [Mycoplasma crocodyli MP145]